MSSSTGEGSPFLPGMEADAIAHPPSNLSRSKPAATNALHAAMDRLTHVVPADPALYPFNGTLTEHQLRALGHAAMKPGEAYWVDAGGGKTGLCIAEASRAYREGDIDGMIVAAPLGPHSQWLDEQLPRWCAVPWRGVDNQWPKSRIEAFFRRANDDVMGVLVMNHDALRTAPGTALINRFLAVFRRPYVVLDESSRLKDHKALRTQAAIALARRGRFRRVLSGTPILRGIENLFTQYDAIEPGLTGFRTYASYRAYYCRTVPVPGTRFASMIVGYRNEGELAHRTAGHAIRIPSSDFRDSNPLFMQVACPMSAKQEAAYDEMYDRLMTRIDANLITAQNALVQLGKLLQIASGYAYDGESVVAWAGDNKISAVHDLLDELDEPVVIFAPFVPLLDRLEAEIAQRKDRPLHRYKNRDSVLAWNASGGVILGNQGSGLGIGQNLQAAAATIYVANNFSAEARWQSRMRTDRMGQERQPRYWDLVAPDTVDLVVLENLERKAEIADFNLQQLRQLL